MRTRNSLYNLLSDIIPQTIIILISFFRVKIFLNYMGADNLGVYQLYGQILSYLSLAELGLTGAAMYFLYKPISEKNYKKINEILSGVRKTFTYILIVMFVVGMVLSLNISFFFKDTAFTNTYLMMTFIIALLTNILGYLTTPYVVMFDSSQEKYKYVLHTQILLIIRHLLQIVLIIIFKNLFVILIVEFIFAIFQNIIIRFLFKKHYPEVKFTKEKDYSFWSKTKELIPHKIGTLVANNIDVIIISKFLGLTSVVIYNCYYYFIFNISILVNRIGSATLASVGNLLVTDKDKSYNIFLEYNSMLFFIASIICVPLALAITSFVGLWYGKDMIVNNFTTILFILILFYSIIRIVLNTFVGAMALYKETIICTCTEIIINLTVSLLLVNKIGIAGLLIGTLLSMVISEYLIKPFVLNKKIFNSNIFIYYLDCLKYFVFSVIGYILFYIILKYVSINNLLIWFIVGTVIFILNFIITLFYYKLINRTSFLSRISFLKKVKFINKFIG